MPRLQLDSRRALPLLALLPLLTATCVSLEAVSRDDVPAEYASMKNPVTLEESEIRYYTRQYKGKCKRCHGLDGTGKGSDAGGPGVPPADFTDTAYMSTRSDGHLFYQILMGGGDRCAMPAFGPESDHAWKEDKIWHMVAFVRRFAEPAAP